MRTKFPVQGSYYRTSNFALKNCALELWCWRRLWCWRTVVLDKTLESPLDSKEIKSVNPKGNQH